MYETLPLTASDAPILYEESALAVTRAELLYHELVCTLQKQKNSAAAIWTLQKLFLITRAQRYLQRVQERDAAGSWNQHLWDNIAWMLGGWFVDSIEGDPSSVIGIGLPLVRTLLERVGTSLAALWDGSPDDPIGI